MKKKEEDDRLKNYYEEKVKGKKTILEVWSEVKEDFVKWSDKKPTIVKSAAGFFERRMDYYSEFYWDGTPRNATTEAEGNQETEDPVKSSENVDADLEEMGLISNEEKEVIEVDQAILDSLFGDEDDDEEEEEEEQQQQEEA